MENYIFVQYVYVLVLSTCEGLSYVNVPVVLCIPTKMMHGTSTG